MLPGMEQQLNEEQIDRTIDLSADKKAAIRAENVIAGRYWGGVEWRIVAEFVLFTALWVFVIVQGVRGAIPLWLGLIVNTAVASTFYMPMHESVHGNISGRVTGMRWLNELVGKLAQPMLMMSHSAHRSSHMKHHAFTNEAGRDPDFATQGRMSELPKKWFAMAMVNTFLPLFALFPALRRLLPAALKTRGERDPQGAKSMFRMWLVTTLVLVVAFASGHGLHALMLWWLPARIQMLWLITVFAWFPHHPADRAGRYVDTRVAVFPGSGLLVRGHDHHALHHLFPRVAHYKLRRLWQEMADDLVSKGVRSEGRATAATGPIVW